MPVRVAGEVDLCGSLVYLMTGVSIGVVQNELVSHIGQDLVRPSCMRTDAHVKNACIRKIRSVMTHLKHQRPEKIVHLLFCVCLRPLGTKRQTPGRSLRGCRHPFAAPRRSTGGTCTCHSWQGNLFLSGSSGWTRSHFWGLEPDSYHLGGSLSQHVDQIHTNYLVAAGLILSVLPWDLMTGQASAVLQMKTYSHPSLRSNMGEP